MINIIKTGISYRFLNINESISFEEYDHLNRNYDTTYLTKEDIPGVFIENVINWNERITLIAGARIDHHNNYGYFFTPRFLFYQ